MKCPLFSFFIAIILTTLTVSAETVSIQEMLKIGSSAMRSHALTMIEKGKAPSDIDESFFPGFVACASDASEKVRAQTAKLLGEFFVKGKTEVEPRAEQALLKLSKDESGDVRYAAIFYGLSGINGKSKAVVEQLLTEAAQTRKKALYDKIVQSLEHDRALAKQIMDKKIQERNSGAFYAIYEPVTGQPAPDRDPSLDAVHVSVEEMLANGDSRIRLNTLSDLSRSPVVEKYLGILMACSTDPASPVRSIAARIIGQNFVPQQGPPPKDVVSTLIKLAQDESPDVRFSAVYHGLSRIDRKSDQVIQLLLLIASENRDGLLYDRIAEGLSTVPKETTRVLDKLLNGTNPISYYEIYADMVGKEPPRTEKFLNMPCSRPELFAFKGDQGDPERHKNNLAAALKKARIENPDLFISDAGSGYVLLLKAHITKNRILIEEKFKAHPVFPYMQKMWLTPEQEIQVDALRRD